MYLLFNTSQGVQLENYIFRLEIQGLGKQKNLILQA